MPDCKFPVFTRRRICLIEAMTTPLQTDVAIIGAGPVGLFAVFQCGMLWLRCHVIDALPDIGGQCTALYPEKPIYDIPGFPTVAAATLIERLEEQAAPFDPVYHTGHTVTGLQSNDGGWMLQTDKGLGLQARAVVIAAGAGAFGPNRPPLANLSDYEGQSVFYMVRRQADLAGRRIVIAGGGDSAVDWALSLADVADSVTVVHRRDKFRAAPESVARMRALAAQDKIRLMIPYQLKALEGEDGRLQAVHLVSTDGNAVKIEADVLLPFFGLAASLGPIADWALDLHKHQIAVDPRTSETGRPGIYAIGDIAHYEHKLKLILTGFAEAAQAAHAIYRRIHPDQALHFEYSTTKGIPSLDKAARDRV